MPVVDLKTFARHGKIETTMKYVHTDEQELRDNVDKLPAIGSVAPAADKNPSEKSVRKCVRAGVSKRQVGSSSGNNGHHAGKNGNDATPCNGRRLSSTDIDFPQRARRDSNPQPPDRQSDRNLDFHLRNAIAVHIDTSLCTEQQRRPVSRHRSC